MAKRGRKSNPNVSKKDSERQKEVGEGKDSSMAVVMPQKKWYRQRAHANVFSDHDLVYPSCPQEQDWSEIYPDYFASPSTSTISEQVSSSQKKVEFADIGCGFGGLLMDLAPLFPENLILGMEIRSSVTQYVHDRIEALRLVHDQHQYLSKIGAISSSKVEDGKFIIDLESIGKDQESEQQPSKRPKTDETIQNDEPISNPNPDALTKVEDFKSQNQDEALQPSNGKGKSKSQSKKKLKKDEEDEEEDEEEEEYSEGLQNSRLLEKARTAAGGYKNVGVVRGNAMKFLPNYFERGQLSKIFFLFPDPHFKVRKHKSRIISPTLLSEYAYVLRPGGIIYTITDVHDLHLWMVEHLNNFQAFDRIPDDDPSLVEDPCVKVVYGSTEEGKKVARNGGDKWFAAFRRREEPVEGEE